MKTFAKSAALLLLATLMSSLLSLRPVDAQTKKEYLSDAEADKIRDAGMTGPRLVLYAIFAGDRIKKLQYEFAHLDPADEKRTDRINSLINGYTGCIDDAADLLDLGLEKQEDMRDGVKALQVQVKEALPYLQDLATKGPERDTYKDNLEDAIEATQDASKDLEKVSKEMAPVPVRRKPS